MNLVNLSRRQWIFLGCCVLLWIAVFSHMAPDFGGTDVYLFRDAACNDVLGHGFRTASFEGSHSFLPVLYSSYTPGSLWLFEPFARAFGCNSMAEQASAFCWTFLADLVALLIVIRFTRAGWLRWLNVILLGALLPFGFETFESDRPEAPALILLVVLAFLMRRPPAWRRVILVALLGGAGFLIEPFAGVVAVLLITGWLALSAFAPWFPEDTSTSGTARATAFLVRGTIAGVCFLLPVAATAAVFYHQDPSSLRRFYHQATVAGVERTTAYRTGDFSEQSAAPPASVPARPRHSFLLKYRSAAAVHLSLGAAHLLEMAGCSLIVLAWLLLLARSPGAWRARLALALLGFSLFVVPLVVFPLQGNYLFLGAAAFPALLAVNWSQVRGALRSSSLIPWFLAANFLICLPASALQVVRRWETLASYRYAQRQSEILSAWLTAHPLKGKVVLVPAGAYFLYKPVAGDIYNPDYLSREENSASVGAVVNCYTATRAFQPSSLSLPTMVAGGQWRLLSSAGQGVHITLLHRNLMSRNWGWGCDIYVPADR